MRRVVGGDGMDDLSTSSSSSSSTSLRPTHSLTPHTSALTSLCNASSRSGSLLASVGLDGTLAVASLLGGPSTHGTVYKVSVGGNQDHTYNNRGGEGGGLLGAPGGGPVGLTAVASDPASGLIFVGGMGGLLAVYRVSGGDSGSHDYSRSE